MISVLWCCQPSVQGHTGTSAVTMSFHATRAGKRHVDGDAKSRCYQVLLAFAASDLHALRRRVVSHLVIRSGVSRGHLS